MNTKEKSDIRTLDEIKIIFAKNIRFQGWFWFVIDIRNLVFEFSSC